MSTDRSRRERERTLVLDFECLTSIVEGVNEVRVWWDKNLQCYLVGKRLDLSCLDDVLPEAATLNSITHDNIVDVRSAAKVEGYGPNERVIEIVTPYYPRGSITDALLAHEQFTARESITVMRSALQGLRELHEVHRIVHRDVKSGNVLLADGPPHALVADLGLAGRMDGEGRVPALNNPTIYSPPEFIESGELDARSDIYGMGLILRELIGGNFRYSDYPRSHVVARLMKLESPLTSADRLLPIWAPKDLRTIYKKATSRRPADRYQTARDMDTALAKARVADWRELDEYRWEADLLHRRGRVRVEATWKPRRGGYLMSAKKKHRTGWARFQADTLVHDLRSTEARKVFDQATMIACAR